MGELLGNQFKYTFSTEKITEEVVNGTSVVSEEPFYIYPDSKLEIQLPELVKDMMTSDLKLMKKDQC